MVKILSALKKVIGMVVEVLVLIGAAVLKVAGAMARLIKANKLFFKWAAVAIILLLATAEIVFGVSIYATHSNDNVTKFMARIIPFPAVVSTSGVVTVADFNHTKTYITHFYSETDQGGYDESTLNEQIVDQLIEGRIINNEANKRKISVSKSEIDAAMEQIAQSNGGDEEVSKALKELYGLSVPEFRKLVSAQLLRDKINKELIARVSVRHILIRVAEDATPEQVEEAKQKITGYRNEILGGTDFAEAAKKYSEDVGSNENGGKLDAFSRGEMVKEFEDVAFSAPSGQLSEPFKTSFGWHVLEVLDKQGEIDKSFDDFLSQLRARAITMQLYRPR
jgi:parvulin-like peptidyl-prolyl isomerase